MSRTHPVYGRARIGPGEEGAVLLAGIVTVNEASRVDIQLFCTPREGLRVPLAQP